MSHTTLKIVRDTGIVEDFKEFRNAFGFSAAIFTVIQEKYMPEKHWLSMVSDEEDNKFWALASDPRLSEMERVLFMSTFDHAIIEFAKLPEAAEHFRAFAGRIPRNHVNHFPAMADTFEKLFAERKDILGVCFHGTSVSQDPWWVFADEEDEAGRPYNIKIDTGHFFVFSRLAEGVNG